MWTLFRGHVCTLSVKVYPWFLVSTLAKPVSETPPQFWTPPIPNPVFFPCFCTVWIPIFAFLRFCVICSLWKVRKKVEIPEKGRKPLIWLILAGFWSILAGGPQKRSKNRGFLGFWGVFGRFWGVFFGARVKSPQNIGQNGKVRKKVQKKGGVPPPFGVQNRYKLCL